MTVVLTKAGFENLDDVLAAVFSYLKMMERVGVSERIFKEIKEIEDLDFEFRELSYDVRNLLKTDSRITVHLLSLCQRKLV